MSSKNILSTKGKALKKAKDFPKVYSQKGFKSGSTVLDSLNLVQTYKRSSQPSTSKSMEIQVMDGKDMKNQEAFSSVVHSFNVVANENFDINQQRILNDFRESAVRAEESAILKEKDIERAIERASSAKAYAEMTRKNADDTEKELRAASLLGSATFRRTLRNMKETADSAEVVAKNKEEAVEFAIKRAAVAKAAAKTMRESADGVEESIKRYKKECSEISAGMTHKIVND